jgi:hypothetical protein
MNCERTMPPSIRNQLTYQKKQLEEFLLAKEPQAMREYLMACSALSGIEKAETPALPSDTKYAGYRQAIEAIEDYLTEVSAFVEQEDLIKVIFDGGYGAKDKYRLRNIKDSIRYHLKDFTLKSDSRRGKKGDVVPAPLIEVDGKIGLAEWGKEALPTLNEK